MLITTVGGVLCTFQVCGLVSVVISEKFYACLLLVFHICIYLILSILCFPLDIVLQVLHIPHCIFSLFLSLYNSVWEVSIDTLSSLILPLSCPIYLRACHRHSSFLLTMFLIFSISFKFCLRVPISLHHSSVFACCVFSNRPLNIFIIVILMPSLIIPQSLSYLSVVLTLVLLLKN